MRSVKSVPIASIRLEQSARVETHPGIVADYAAEIGAGHNFPPILIFDDGESLWLVDGLHRLQALERCGRSEAVAEIRAGSVEAAIWEGCACNKGHGLRRSNADKHRSVTRALRHPRGQRLSDRQLGTYCGVHHRTVGRVRAELASSGALPEINQRQVRRGGSLYLLAVNGVSEANKRRSKPLPTATDVGLDESTMKLDRSGAMPQIGAPNSADLPQPPGHRQHATPQTSMPSAPLEGAGGNEPALAQSLSRANRLLTEARDQLERALELVHDWELETRRWQTDNAILASVGAHAAPLQDLFRRLSCAAERAAQRTADQGPHHRHAGVPRPRITMSGGQ